ncbi:hypothetical protein L523_2410 [Bordetella bronchiseptica MBORD731]|nr:hypothetical protein L523_2410 [Bordetella bronchiseptica MBORD731]
MQVRLLRIGRGQREVDLAGAHQVERRARQRVVHFQRHPGMGLPVRHQHARQQARGQRRQRRHRHLAVLGAGDAADRVDGLAKRHLQRGGLLHEHLAGGRQPHGARGAVEQAHAQRLLDAQHLGRQCRLRQVQLRRRLPEIERAAQYQDGLDIAHGQIDLHGTSLI